MQPHAAAPHQRVFGIVISLYWAEHRPPASTPGTGSIRAAVDIATLEVIGGGLPTRDLRLVREL
jgi:hypothetical protein